MGINFCRKAVTRNLLSKKNASSEYPFGSQAAVTGVLANGLFHAFGKDYFMLQKYYVAL